MEDKILMIEVIVEFVLCFLLFAIGAFAVYVQFGDNAGKAYGFAVFFYLMWKVYHRERREKSERKIKYKN